MPELKPIGLFTDDHLADKSATTYDAEVADRWRQKGWQVTPLYAIPADQVLVPRELLEAALKRSPAGTAEEFYAREKAICELRALLRP